MKRRARRGSGHLYQRGRVWWFKWYSANGVPHYRSSGSKIRAEAEAMLRAELDRVGQGAPVLPNARRVRVETILDGLRIEYKLNARRSAGRTDLSCRHLLRFFEGRVAVSITGADIGKYSQLRLAERAAPATINRELSALRRAYRLAIRQGLLATMPVITALREDNVRVGFLESDQLAAICRHLPSDEADAVEFMFVSGWRSRSEALPLRWAQVDFGAGFVRLEPGTTKNRQGRQFPLTPTLRALLERRLEMTRRCERAQGRVIPWVFHRGGQPIHSMRRSWKTACRKAGLPGRLLHDLRRSAVRNLVRAGISERVAMTLSGHQTRSVFDRYNIVSEADLREAGTKLSAVAVTENGDSLGGLQ